MVAEMMRKVQSLQMLFELVLEPKFRVTLHVCHAQQQEHHLTESAFVVRTYATRMNITGVQCECVARNDMCFNVDPYVTDVTTECLGAGSGPHSRSKHMKIVWEQIMWDACYANHMTCVYIIVPFSYI
jgi:hypothetical protein